jgi:glycosyltransferase involved in cell wall biosynthesis
MNPTLSIIIPVYNKAAYLGDCIRSVLDQSFTDFELILVNDGSTDTSDEICHEYEAFDERIIVIDQPNAGVSAARNTGIKHAIGHYVGFIDADDTIEPDMYELLINNILAYNADISVCRLRTILPGKTIHVPEQTKAIVLNYEDALSACLKGDLDRSANNKIYKLALVRNIFFEGHIYEDVLFTCKAFLKSQVTVVQHTTKYNYILRDNSVSMRLFNARYLETINVSATIVRLVSASNKKCLIDAQIFDIISNLSLLNMLLLIGKEHYMNAYQQVLNNLRSYHSIINSNALGIKHKYALRLFNFWPQLYGLMMHCYGIITHAELIKRTQGNDSLYLKQC